MSSIKKLAGVNLARLREARGLSQAELGKLIGMEKGSVSRIETGVNFLSPEKIDAIMKALSIDASELFKAPGYQSKPTPEEALQVLAEAIRKPVAVPDLGEEIPQLLKVIEGRSAKDIIRLTKVVSDWIADEDEVTLRKPILNK